MSAVRVVPMGAGRFKVFIDGHEISQVVAVDTSKLVQLNALPELSITFNPDSFEIEPLPQKAPVVVETTCVDAVARRFGQP